MGIWRHYGSWAAVSYIAGIAKRMFHSSPMHSSAFPNGDLFSLDWTANQLSLIINYVYSLNMTTYLSMYHQHQK